MMAIAWVVYGLIHWQPAPCKPCLSIASLSGDRDSCCNQMVPPFEIYYEWAPPTVMTLEVRYE